MTAPGVSGGEFVDVEQRIKNMFDLSLDLFCVAGSDGYFKIINPSFQRILGYSEQELTTIPFLQLVHPADRQETSDEVDRLAKGMPTRSFRNRYRCKNGTYRWFEWNAVPVEEEGAIYAVARDVTELKQIELKCRTVVECAPIAMILIDPQGDIVLANRQIETIFGYTPRELTGRKALVLIPERFHGEYARFRKAFAKKPRKKQVGIRRTLYGLRKDGTEVPVDLAVGPVDLNGSYVLVTVSDISRRLQFEEERSNLARDLEVTRYALDEGAIVSISDSTGGMRYVNDRMCAISGYSREELLGRTFQTLSAGFQTPEFFREMWETISNSEIWRGEVRNRAKDGSSFWLDMTIVPVGKVDGGPKEYFLICFDASARKESEEVQQRLFRAVEQAADPIFITDRDGVIEYVNPAFETTTGYPAEEAVGRNPKILKSGYQDENYYESLWKQILAGEAHRSTPINRKKNGDLFHAEQTITPVKDSSGLITHFVSVVKDVTLQRKAEERRIEMQIAAEVQQKLYPRCAPRLQGFDLAGAVVPAVEACGDYFDYIPMPDGATGIAIGDMTGHGFGPALMMAETRAYLRSLARTISNPCEILTHMNQALASDLKDNHYASLLLARLDPRSRTLHYVNAGHYPGYVLDRDGRVKAVLDSASTPLGMFADSTYDYCREIVLASSDVVILSTDGLAESERADGEEFGTDRILETVRDNLSESAEVISQRLIEAAREYTDAVIPRDDITVVVCKVGEDG